VIARDTIGVHLYRVDGPIVILSHVKGLYPNDTWSGKSVVYQRVECAGGTLASGISVGGGRGESFWAGALAEHPASARVRTTAVLRRCTPRI